MWNYRLFLYNVYIRNIIRSEIEHEMSFICLKLNNFRVATDDYFFIISSTALFPNNNTAIYFFLIFEVDYSCLKIVVGKIIVPIGSLVLQHKKNMWWFKITGTKRKHIYDCCNEIILQIIILYERLTFRTSSGNVEKLLLLFKMVSSVKKTTYCCVRMSINIIGNHYSEALPKQIF